MNMDYVYGAIAFLILLTILFAWRAGPFNF